MPQHQVNPSGMPQIGSSGLTRHRARPVVDGATMKGLGEQLGARVRALRKRLSCTQEDLAHRANISVSFLSMVERGERLPRLETLAALADGLGVTIGELFTGVNQPQENSPQLLRPLIAFLEGQPLDSDDLERLLTIARVLFKTAK